MLIKIRLVTTGYGGLLLGDLLTTPSLTDGLGYGVLHYGDKG